MNQEEWIAELKGIQPALFEGLRRMVAIPSIRGEAEEGAPYGKGPRQALDEVLAIASELGFQMKNIDNKIGYAQYGEDRSDGAYYGIFGHVDVMPLGEGWISPALALQFVTEDSTGAVHWITKGRFYRTFTRYTY